MDNKKQKSALILASSYITGFEILKSAIVEHLENYFFDKKDYEKDVLVKGEKKFDSSCKWYLKKGIITENELNKLKAIKNYRNTLAHELVNIMFTPDEKINMEQLEELNFFIKKIDSFWGEMEGVDLKKDDFKSLRMIVMEFIIDTTIELNRKNYS